MTVAFYNKGLLDLACVTTMGVSVKQAGSFGRFGTGLKYAIATILRGGGVINIWRGQKCHFFSTQTQIIRDEAFEVVCMDGQPIGFTTRLGRDWQPWMVLRELGCNARDEGGAFEIWDEEKEGAIQPAEDQTLIIVEWKDLDDAYAERASLFLEGEPIYEDERIRIIPQMSPYLYHRSVRVFKLPKPSIMTYDILVEQTLTEDRTLASHYEADRIIKETLLKLTDKTAIERAVVSGENYHESGFQYDAVWGADPSREFLAVVSEAREAKRPGLNDSARKVMLKAMRETTDETEATTRYSQRSHHGFDVAIGQLSDFGISFPDDQIFLEVGEMPNPDQWTMVESRRVYYIRGFFDQPDRVVLTELLKRWVDLQDVWGAEDVASLFIPLVIRSLIGEEEDEEPAVEAA